MRILHLLSQKPESTGSGIYLQAMLEHAGRQGYRNSLLAGVPASFSPPDSLRCEQLHLLRFEEDLDFPIVGMSDVMPYPSARFSDLDAGQLLAYEARFLERLGAAIVHWRPDLIHSHHLWLLTSMARRAFPEIPMVTSCHGSDLRQFRQCDHLREQVLEGCRDVDAVCALSAAQRDEIARLYSIDPSKIFVTGAGYDEERFNSGCKASASVPQVLYAGKLSRAKGVPWLLRAWRRMEDVDAVLHLAGDGSGEEKEEILRLSEDCGRRVVWHGRLTQEELAERMRLCHLFVLPSFFEGVPLVLLEALACGCRLLATALSGVSEIFAEKGGDWVHLLDPPSMAGVDRPLGHEEEPFVARIENALRRQIALADEEGGGDIPGALSELLLSHRWDGVFSRVETVYGRVFQQ